MYIRGCRRGGRGGAQIRGGGGPGLRPDAGYRSRSLSIYLSLFLSLSIYIHICLFLPLSLSIYIYICIYIYIYIYIYNLPAMKQHLVRRSGLKKHRKNTTERNDGGSGGRKHLTTPNLRTRCHDRGFLAASGRRRLNNDNNTDNNSYVW